MNHEPPRTIVTFASDAFNTNEHRPYFINEGCFGDDLCRWLIDRLRERGVSTAPEPGQEDFGWYVTFTVDSAEHCLVVTFSPAEEAGDSEWIGEIERQRGFFASIVGRRATGILPRAVEVIHHVLANAAQIARLQWHQARDYKRGRYDQGTATP